MPKNSNFIKWVDELSPRSTLFLVGEIWGEHDFDNTNIEYLKECFKESKKVYNYYTSCVVNGN